MIPFFFGVRFMIFTFPLSGDAGQKPKEPEEYQLPELSQSLNSGHSLD